MKGGKTKQESPAAIGGTLLVRAATAYLLVAHMYILISIPTETSTIFGAFQTILFSL